VGKYAAFLDMYKLASVEEIDNYYKRALELLLQSATYVTKYSEFLLATSHDSVAVKAAVRRAINLDPFIPSNHSTLAAWFDESGDIVGGDLSHEQATLLEKSNKYLASSFIQPRCNKTFCGYIALYIYRDILSWDPNHVFTLLNLVQLLVYRKADANDIIDRLYSRAITLEPSNVICLQNYGLFLTTFKRDDFSHCEKMFNKALAIDSKDFISLYGLAQAL